MSEFAITPGEAQQIAMLHAHLSGGGSLTAPFAQEIFLIETHVAGTNYVETQAIEPELQADATFILRREPENAHDDLAILILTESGKKMGYIPKDRNEILARLMDAGKFLFGRMESSNWKGTWLYIRARIFLKDV